LAKTQRDRLMELYDVIYPEYGYGTHKGYPTASHREAVGRCGPSPIQRLSFKTRSSARASVFTFVQKSVDPLQG
ncbi:MAG: hypothetical protein LBL56_05070, partial [Treponema sp.]|nr:hypothetical protein [Treponema sp.]